MPGAQSVGGVTGRIVNSVRRPFSTKQVERNAAWSAQHQSRMATAATDAGRKQAHMDLQASDRQLKGSLRSLRRNSVAGGVGLGVVGGLAGKKAIDARDNRRMAVMNADYGIAKAKRSLAEFAAEVGLVEKQEYNGTPGQKAGRHKGYLKPLPKN